jgi:hypothetical protein
MIGQEYRKNYPNTLFFPKKEVSSSNEFFKKFNEFKKIQNGHFNWVLVTLKLDFMIENFMQGTIFKLEPIFFAHQ